MHLFNKTILAIDVEILIYFNSFLLFHKEIIRNFPDHFFDGNFILLNLICFDLNDVFLIEFQRRRVLLLLRKLFTIYRGV